MISKITPNFKKHFKALPKEIKKEAKDAYRLWKKEPDHPSLNFELISSNIWSVRVGLHYRAYGLRKPPDTMTWDWIGSHEEYNKLLKKAKEASKFINRRLKI